MKKTAIIVAGGTGARMGTQLPKQFLLLAGKPVLWYTLQRFLESFSDLEIVLVLPEAHWELGNQLLEVYFLFMEFVFSKGYHTYIYIIITIYLKFLLNYLRL